MYTMFFLIYLGIDQPLNLTMPVTQRIPLTYINSELFPVL